MAAASPVIFVRHPVSDKVPLQFSSSVYGADVAFELGLQDNVLTGTIPSELHYLPVRVSHT